MLLEQWNGKSLLTHEPEVVIESDAVGGGGIISRPLNLLTLFAVRATHFHSEIGLSHSEMCV